MTEYVPSTEEVRAVYFVRKTGIVVSAMSHYPEFDEWLNEIRAEAWDECVTQMPLDLDWKNQYLDLNPYRPNEK